MKQAQDPTPKTLKEQGFYHTPAWRRVRRAALIRDGYICQGCHRRPAVEVHHIQELERVPELALDVNNLTSLCHECHEATKHRGFDVFKAVPRGVRALRP